MRSLPSDPPPHKTHRTGVWVRERRLKVMEIGGERVIVKLGREAGSMLLHAVLLAGMTLGFHYLIGDPEWTQAALAAFLLAYPIRYVAVAGLYRPGSSFFWHGWMCADLMFFGLMGWKFDGMESGGMVLAGLILMPAALFVSPLMMARFNAGVVVLYALLLNARGVSLDSPGLWSSEVAGLILFVGASMTVSASRMRSRSEPSALREVASDLFEQLHLNLAILDEQGRFILANSRAVKTLERGQKELASWKFSDLIFDASGLERPFRCEGARSGLLTRRDGSLCPMAYEAVPLTLQGELLGRGNADELFECQLVVFTDVSDLVAGREALSRQDRNQTVRKMLEVFADGVRNPLAGISAYAQVLLRNEEKRSGGEDSEQRKMYRQIVEDIEGLDSLLEELMINTRLTPEEVEEHFATLKARRQTDGVNGPVHMDF